jgi:protein disulfide-isomerase
MIKKKSVILVILLLILSIVQADTIKWQSNIDEALQKAKVNGKFVFVFFTGSDWCSWCKKLNSEVFDHQEFQNYAAKNMEMVLLDFPKSTPQSQEQSDYNKLMQQKYSIAGYPSVVILDKKGAITMQLGYREGGAAKYVEFIESGLKWNLSSYNDTWKDEKGQIWYKNLTKAQELAAKNNKHILINFTGSDWCIWCKRLTNEVFEKPEFIKFASENLILLRIDFPQETKLPPGEESYNNSLAQKFAVEGFPTLFLLDGKGKTVKQLGYEEGGATPYVAMLRELIK